MAMAIVPATVPFASYRLWRGRFACLALARPHVEGL